MGKSKKRTLIKPIEKNSVALKRCDIVRRIFCAVKNHKIDEETVKYINLFGIKAEELTEAGITYEELSLVKHFLS